MNETLDGEIYEIIYQNEDNGYTVCEVSCNNSIVTVCGHMPFIAPGVGVHMTGRWVTHPDYGEQFYAESIERSMPKEEDSVLAYLASGIVSGVRESTARKIVEKFGDRTLEIIATEPELLSEIKGISLMRARKISESFLIGQDAAKTVMFLQEYGVSANIALRVHKKFGQKAIELIRENPYILCENIDRIGFKTSDRIALEMNLPNNHPGRISSGIKYALQCDAVSGHTCLAHDELIKQCVRLLGCAEDEVIMTYHTLSENGSIIREAEYDFLPLYYNMEVNAAQRLAALVKNGRGKIRVFDNDIENAASEGGIKLSEMQLEAVRMASENGALVITGGPGTGKTTIMKTVLNLFERQELKISLCAPTGKAAKRLTESCGAEAKTLHRLLEVNAADGEENHTFARNEQNPLEADVVIVDEMSMVDIVLFGSLLKAMKRGARLIMAGDVDQLPSVGAGNVLRDILDSGVVPSVRLNEVFRQAGESRIVTNAHRINRGEIPLANESNSDFFFMPRTAEEALDTICELCAGRLKKAYGFDAMKDIQVLSPSRKGIVGTQNLNVVLQEKLNPPSKNKKEKKFGERIFRTGDKVIQTRNNYDMIWSTDGGTDGMGIYNGDIGIILDISQQGKYMTIKFDDKTVEYDFSSVEDLDIAYALTVHKSQGCEFPAVIIPVCSFPPRLMTRNLLYTAVTRARQLAIIVGSDASVMKMVKNDRVQVRYSRLRERLCEII